MPLLNVSPNSTRLKALKASVEMSIDMFNDMAVDDMWMNPKQVRELATKSDEEIRAEMCKNSKAVYENIDQLVTLQFLYAELNNIE